jgi:hypothetical protein
MDQKRKEQKSDWNSILESIRTPDPDRKAIPLPGMIQSLQKAVSISNNPRNLGMPKINSIYQGLKTS